MNYEQEIAAVAKAKRFAEDWFARSGAGREQQVLEMFAVALISDVHSSATLAERARIAKKLASLTS